jgi:hypothetical protein
MGPTALFLLQRKSCYGFLSPLKIHRPRPGINPRTLGPMASTITTRPPTVTPNMLKSSNRSLKRLTSGVWNTIVCHFDNGKWQSSKQMLRNITIYPTITVWGTDYGGKVNYGLLGRDPRGIVDQYIRFGETMLSLQRREMTVSMDWCCWQIHCPALRWYMSEYGAEVEWY